MPARPVDVRASRTATAAEVVDGAEVRALSAAATPAIMEATRMDGAVQEVTQDRAVVMVQTEAEVTVAVTTTVEEVGVAEATPVLEERDKRAVLCLNGVIPLLPRAGWMLLEVGKREPVRLVLDHPYALELEVLCEWKKE